MCDGKYLLAALLFAVPYWGHKMTMQNASTFESWTFFFFAFLNIFFIWHVRIIHHTTGVIAVNINHILYRIVDVLGARLQWKSATTVQRHLRFHSSKNSPDFFTHQENLPKMGCNRCWLAVTQAWRWHPQSIIDAQCKAKPEWQRVLCCGALSHWFEPHQCLWVWLQVHRSPEVNQESILCRWKSKQVSDPPWLWNLAQTSPLVQKRGISGPTKRTCVLQNLKKRTLSVNGPL